MSSIHAPLFPNAAAPYEISSWHASALPMLFGPLSGQRWLPFSGGKILRLLLGRYEPDQSQAIQRSLYRGNVFYDVGAATGYYSLLAARRVGPTGCVVAFEPDPRNAAFLRKHVAVNRLTNVIVYQSAVSNRAGIVQFARGTGTGTGHLSDSGESSVSVCRLDDTANTTRIPTHIKIDVEGAELQVLEGAKGVLSGARPLLFLSLHGEQMEIACRRLLRGLDYDIQPMSSDARHADEVLCTPR